MEAGAKKAAISAFRDGRADLAVRPSQCGMTIFALVIHPCDCSKNYDVFPDFLCENCLKNGRKRVESHIKYGIIVA